jgi:4-carboxymuconolactone decarboxylase
MMLFARALIDEGEGTVRLPPLPADQWDDTVQQALSVMLPEARRTPDAASNVLSTLVWHPDLTKAFLRFNVHLLMRSTLPPRIRELAILRVAHRTNCVYEWTHHVDLGHREGLTDDEIEGIRRGELSDEFDRTILAAVDELFNKSELSDATWAALAERFDERQRMDFIFTVGCYNALAMALNTFGVEVEKDHEPAHQKGR